MINVILLSLFTRNSVASLLKTNLSLHAGWLNSDFPSNFKLKSNLFSLTPDNDFICTTATQINEKDFTDLVRIKSGTGCQTISVINCKFISIVIPENSQSDGQFSIIYVHNADLSIEDSTFQECASKSKYNLQLDSSSKSDSIACHCILIDENLNNKVTINNCNFLDNGYEDKSDGTIIFSNKASNIEILFSLFKSEKKFARAFQSIYDKEIILTSNSFFKMIGPIGQNGGAILIQFSTNASVCDCIFDSNTLQSLFNDSSEKIQGSAIFINLNESFTFINNTIQNHDTYLNSVVTFNQNSYKSRNLTILNSNFINNKYSKTFDGSGIGFYVEDYNEKLNSNSESYI